MNSIRRRMKASSLALAASTRRTSAVVASRFPLAASTKGMKRKTTSRRKKSLRRISRQTGRSRTT